MFMQNEDIKASMANVVLSILFLRSTSEAEPKKKVRSLEGVEAFALSIIAICYMRRSKSQSPFEIIFLFPCTEFGR